MIPRPRVQPTPWLFERVMIGLWLGALVAAVVVILTTGWGLT